MSDSELVAATLACLRARGDEGVVAAVLLPAGQDGAPRVGSEDMAAVISLFAARRPPGMCAPEAVAEDVELAFDLVSQAWPQAWEARCALHRSPGLHALARFMVGRLGAMAEGCTPTEDRRAWQALADDLRRLRRWLRWSETEAEDDEDVEALQLEFYEAVEAAAPDRAGVLEIESRISRLAATLTTRARRKNKW